MKPLTNNLEYEILENLRKYGATSSNKLHQKLQCNKKRYTDIKNYMIEQKFIKEETKGNRKYLSRIDFESPKFQDKDFTKTIIVNCNHYMKNLRKMKPIATSHTKKYTLKKDAKMVLDALFGELDKLHTICVRLEYARLFGMINPKNAKYHRNECLKLFDEMTVELFFDHKKFKTQIISHYQSDIRTLKFMV